MTGITEKQVEERVKAFLTSCRQQGIRVTHQRTEILRALAGTGEHPDAETLYRRVRERVPAISLDTVYRTLRLLEENGAIVRMSVMKERARFDANTSQHHHFVCTQCGLVRDFYDEAFDRLKASPGLPEAGLVDSVYVELRGLCRSCREQRRKERRTRRS